MGRFRTYLIIHSYINPVQVAVQSLHAQAELYCRYKERVISTVNDPTIIILNGGNSKNMTRLVELFNEHDSMFSTFHEPDIQGIMTAICVVVNADNVEDIRNRLKINREYGKYGKFSNPVEYEIATMNLRA